MEEAHAMLKRREEVLVVAQEGNMKRMRVYGKSSRKSVSPSAHKRKLERDVGEFKKGQKLEAENDDSYPMYKDTIHIVEYVGLSMNGRHKCKMSCFVGEPVYEWDRKQLYRLRELEYVQTEFNVGDNVHVFLEDRAGVNADGVWEEFLDGTDGVWVKAKVVSIEEGGYKVEHASWNLKQPNTWTTRIIDSEDHIRSSYV